MNMISNNEKRIIEILKVDSRQSIKDISKKTNIKPSTVYQTIRRLKDNGTIEKFSIKLNDKKINRNFVVFMLVTTTKDLDPAIIRSKHIEDIHGVTGEYDLLLKLKFSGVDEFNKFVIDLRKNKSISKTLTMVATAKVKEL